MRGCWGPSLLTALTTSSSNWDSRIAGSVWTGWRSWPQAAFDSLPVGGLGPPLSWFTILEPVVVPDRANLLADCFGALAVFKSFAEVRDVRPFLFCVGID